MHDSAPGQDDGRTANPDAAPSGPPPSSGVTRFLVDGPESAGISREALVEAVRALIRERDYLRSARDIQLADFEEEVAGLTEHAAELEESLARETEASRSQADELKRELAALRAERDKLLRERDAILADHAAVEADRDLWKSLVKSTSLRTRLRQKLEKLAGRRPGADGEAAGDTPPPPGDARSEPQAAPRPGPER